MKYYAIGWACTLNDIFVRFPYEKCKNLPTKNKLAAIKKVFIEGVNLILEDIVKNNATFKIQGIGVQGGEIHMEPIRGEEFIAARKRGKFKDIDFLESLFTGFQMYLYIHGKRDNVLSRKKIPMYYSKYFRDIVKENTNKGKQYC